MGSPHEYGEKIGEYLIRVREIQPKQVENVLLRQECGDRRKFGEIAVDLRYIENATLEGYLLTNKHPLWKKSVSRSVTLSAEQTVREGYHLNSSLGG